MTQQDPTLAALAAALPARAPAFLPADAPFDEAQRQFLNGLLAGLAAAASGAGAGEAPAGTALTILYGSQSGTCEALAKDLRKRAAAQGFNAAVAELDSTAPTALSETRHLLVVAATFGEGEPTDNARGFHAALMDPDAPQLPATLNFAVLGLGDSSYAGFNQAARDIDARLGALGATRAAEAAFCDVGYEEDYAAWTAGVFAAPAFADAAGAVAGPVIEAEPAPAFDKSRPFPATVLGVRRLSGSGEGKIVNHIEISLAGGGVDMAYRAGDALGVWPVNCPDEVARILEATGFGASAPVMLKGGPAPLRAALLSKLDLTTLAPAARAAWGAAEGAQVIDALRGGVEGLTPQSLVDALRPLQPRLYSISSCPQAHPGEVHLTVGEVRYELGGAARKGCASTFFADRVATGSTVGVYVQRNPHFHPPADEAPLVMIGPGTGIAPFRAFLQERAARGASGENWLFFGDRTAARDYLYEAEIEAWRGSGLLTRLSLAWSRDGAGKVYVQHLMEREGAVLWDWLERGAAIYLCGDAGRMATDVDRALHAVIAREGGMGAKEAAAYVDALRREDRYRRDVY